MTNDTDTLVHLLQAAHTIAVVGLSNDADRPSYVVASYLQRQGYHIIPVTPQVSEILGEQCYPNLLSIPEPVDIVDIFRRAEFVPDIVDQAIKIGAKTVWMQTGIVEEAAAEKARQAGLTVIMDQCMHVEHARLKMAGLL